MTPLILDLKLGLPQAVETWYKQYSKPLLQFVLAKVRAKKDAEEIVRDTFMSCLKHLPLFRGECNIETWMKRIARHEIADFYRKKYAKRAIQTTPFSSLLFVEPTQNRKHTSKIVKRALSKMSQKYKELLLLKYVDGKQVKEIAKQLGRSVKSIESDLYRAREEFRFLYAHMNEEFANA